MMRIGKFLAGRPKVVWELPNQELQTAIDILCRRKLGRVQTHKEIYEWRMCNAWQALHKGMIEDTVDHSKNLRRK